MRGMNTKPLLSFAVLSDFSLTIDEDGLLQILPYGQFRAVDGRPFDAPYYLADDTIGYRLAAQLNMLKTDLVIDYEHQTLNAKENGEPAPAAGWLKAHSYVWKLGKGLFARSDWTNRAQAFIDNKEYRYLSPVLSYDPTTGEIYAFFHIALTNTPALDNLPEIMAALSQTFQKTEQKPMEALKLLKQLLGLAESADDTQTTAALNTAINQMTGNKGIAACNTTLSQFIQDAQKQVVALSAEPDPAKYVGVSVMTEVQKQVVALSNQLKAIETEKAQSLITVALSDGRLLPAQKEWAENLATSNITALTQFLSTTTPVAALNQTQTNGQPPAGVDNKTAVLTETQIAVCSQLGISQEDYLKAKETE